jgi:serine/threonine protein kinase
MNNSESDNSSDKLCEPITFKERYKIEKKLGSGSFGDVYLAVWTPKNIKTALKVEYKNKAPRIQNEYNIYSKIHRNGYVKGIPLIYEFVETAQCNIMVMELLGQSLDDLFKSHDEKFSIGCVFKIGYQILELLEQIHKKGYIHRDIKPNNFLIGYEEMKNQIYIMDFGLSKKYRDKDGEHIRFKDKKQLVGTPRYVSINIHLGFEPSRRDDVESIGYMLIYFLKGSLPWQNLKKRKDDNAIELIGKKKMATSIQELCDGIPSVFKEYLEYCRAELDFDAEPDYNYLKNLFIYHANDLNINMKFDWE